MTSDYFRLLALAGSTASSSCETALRLSFSSADLGKVAEMNVIAMANTYSRV
jgi:hypothetical protein